MKASAADTVYLENLYDIGLPDAPHRLLRNKTVTNWEEAGRPEPEKRPGEGDIVATSRALGSVVRYCAFLPAPDVEGDIDELPLWSGQGVGLANKVQPAAEIVREIYDQELAVIARMGQLSAQGQ